jgi:hypothetical protein
LANVIPAYDELLTHLEDQQEYQLSLDHATPHLVAAITTALTKLNKYSQPPIIGFNLFCLTLFRYYMQLDDTPAHYASVALHPNMMFYYSQEEWVDLQMWINKASEDTQKLRIDHYIGSTDSCPTGISPGATDIRCTFGIDEGPAVKMENWARLTRGGIDALERFQQTNITQRMIDYWI